VSGNTSEGDADYFFGIPADLVVVIYNNTERQFTLIAKGVERFQCGVFDPAGIFDFNRDNSKSTFEDQVYFGTSFCSIMIGCVGVLPDWRGPMSATTGNISR